MILARMGDGRLGGKVPNAPELGTLGIKVISMDDQFLVGSYGQWQVPIPPPTP